MFESGLWSWMILRFLRLLRLRLTGWLWIMAAWWAIKQGHLTGIWLNMVKKVSWQALWKSCKLGTYDITIKYNWDKDLEDFVWFHKFKYKKLVIKAHRNFGRRWIKHKKKIKIQKKLQNCIFFCALKNKFNLLFICSAFKF